MQLWTSRTLALLGSTGVGSGLGVVVPLTAEYSKDRNASETMDGGDEILGRSRRGTSTREAPDYLKKAEKSVSGIKNLLTLLPNRNKRQIDYAFNGLRDLIKNRFKADERKRQGAWDEVKESLSDIRKTHKKVIDWQAEWVKKQNKWISEKFEELKAIVKDIKDTQNNVVNWQSKYSKKTLLPEINSLLGLSRSLKSSLSKSV